MRLLASLLWVMGIFGFESVHAADGVHFRVIPDVEYASVDGKSLKLDLYLPTGTIRSPCIVWIHGGAWRSGSKQDVPIRMLAEEGYAIASVDYRLSTEAKFPAQIHDLKAAIRFLRAHQRDWKLRTRQIVMAGESAGAHLAMLVGVSNGDQELEGTVGVNPGETSAVQGILSFYGAANLTTILNQSTPFGLEVRVPALKLLLGNLPTNAPSLARLASPVFHVDRYDPPMLLLHGDQDPQMPVNQSLEAESAYKKVGAHAQMVIVHGAAHGGPLFYDAERMDRVRRFLQKGLSDQGPSGKQRGPRE